jgi:hypothetical protein
MTLVIKFWSHGREHSWAFLTLIYRAQVVSAYSELERDVEDAPFLPFPPQIHLLLMFLFLFSFPFFYFYYFMGCACCLCVGCFLMISDESFVYARAWGGA